IFRLAAFFEVTDDVRALAALPDDGGGDRLARGAIPEDGGLALVGDADGGNAVDAAVQVIQDPAHDPHRHVPDIVRVVVDPPGSRVDLVDLLLRDFEAPAGAIHHDGPARCGALIDRRNEVR